MTGRHRPSAPPMHADDPVAPGIKRSRSAYLVAAGLLIIVAAVAGSIVALSTGVQNAQDSATLSSDETRQLREFLADRGRQRDQERADVQAQLDAQRAVLCAAITTLQASATRPTPRAVLGRAATELQCAKLPTASRTSSTADRTTPRASSPTTPLPTPATTTAVARRPAAVLRARAATPSASSTTSSSRPSSTPKPSPTPTPKPTPAPMTPPPALLDPVLQPVCNLLGVCQ